MEASVTWKDGMSFDANLEGFSFAIDADPKFGGQGKGPRPKGLTLVSLAGCTAMDVVSILGKMKIMTKVEGLEISCDGNLAEDHPKKFTNIVVKYNFKGENLSTAVDKIKHAIELSMENYCGVSASLKPTVKFSYQLIINDQLMD
jgi:putative redox protein